MAKLREVCTRKVVVARPETTVGEAAALMRRHHVGAVVVCEPADRGRQTPVGIVTDRDIVVEVVAPDLRPDTITVGDIMDRRLVTVPETETVLKALETMRHHGVRRVPIVGKGGYLAGIVSTDDLARVLPAEMADIGMIAARGRARESAVRK
jgi:CBS domain-containing protein